LDSLLLEYDFEGEKLYKARKIVEHIEKVLIDFDELDKQSL